MATQGPDPAMRAVVNIVNSLLNSQLKTILRREQLPVSGVKSILQARVIERLFSCADQYRLNQLKAHIYTVAGLQQPTPAQSPGPIHPHSAAPLMPTQTRQPYPGAIKPTQPVPTGRLAWKESPFYTVVKSLTPVVECKAREQTRDSVELKIILNPETAARLGTEPNLRVMVYCAADNGLTHYTRCDIAFPYQCELKVNLDDVKANLRGLKNKPGTTRPADITNFIRKKPAYLNNVVMTYALTQKKFYVVANLVRRHSAQELVKEMQTRKTISAEQVIREMRNKAEDADIVATSSVLSLKCPLSTLRINAPCRTSVCAHNQCFDALSFLQLQEQAPTWSCPICNKSTNFESLQIDQYVDNILQSTPSTIDQVTIEPSGAWSKPRDPETSTTPHRTPSQRNNGDDLIEIVDELYPPLKREFDSQHIALSSETPTPSREPSTVSSAPRPSSNKRPASQVIDLTISDDDEDEPPRPAKRIAFNPSNGIPRAKYPPHPPNNPLRFNNSNSSSSPVPNQYRFDS